MVGLRQNLISFLKRATKNANDRPLKHQNSPNFQFFTFSVRSLKKFKFKKWPFLVKIFCPKTKKRVAHQISYGSRSLLNFLRSNQSKKIFPISKVRTFGFQLLSKFMYPPLWKVKNFFRPIWKKMTFLKSARQADFRNVIFFEIRQKNFWNFSNEHKDPGLWFLSKVQNQRYGPLKWGKFFVFDLATKNSVDYLNHKKFDEQLFLGIWSKKFWAKKTIFGIWSQIWNLRILTKKVENSNFWLFQRLRGLSIVFFVARFKNEVRFYLSPPVFAQNQKINP